jgi:thiol:disulfide interchange protein DsbG
LQKLVYAPMAKEIWGKFEASNWIQDGNKDAPRTVYLFSDPNCPYCNMFWEQARPWVKAGKVQLRHIMVGIIREDSPAKSAALLAAKDPAKALEDHEKAGKASTLKPLKDIPKAVQTKLAANMQLMEDLELQATPAIFYMDDKGELQQQQGAPSPDKLAKILGPK